MANVKIVSGGQTGVDQGALEAAVALGLEFGGWAPARRLAEKPLGAIPEVYRAAMREYLDGRSRGTRDPTGGGAGAVDGVSRARNWRGLQVKVSLLR